MSLINKMLKDLEKRDAFLDENSDQVLDGLYSAYDVELNHKRKSSRFLLSLISFIGIGFLLAINYSFIEEKFAQFISAYQEINHSDDYSVQYENTEKKVSISSVSDKRRDNDNETEKNPEIQSRSLLNNVIHEAVISKTLKLDENIVLTNKQLSKTKLNIIESIRFEVDSSGINLIMKMPDDIDYLVYGLTNPERTVIEVKNAKLGFKLEELTPVEPIVAIRYSINDKNKFKLVLESESPLIIRKSVTSKSDDSNNLMVMMDYQWDKNENVTKEKKELEVIVDKQVKLEKEIVFKGDLVKTPVSKSTDAYAEKLFQQAYISYKKGDVSDSFKKLNIVLNYNPAHTKARSTLALALSEKGHYELAYSVLNEGLIQYPENTEWLKVYAQLLLGQGKIIEASNLLKKQKPELAYNTDYFALQAAVLQKLEQHNEAAKIYRDLLHVNPLKAVWWMGLGISLESLKRYDDALYAYQKASNNKTLANDSRKFIIQRINRITNLLEDESS